MNTLLCISDISPNKAVQIFSRINTDKKTGCWLWTGSRNAEGYGYASYHHKTVYIHRFIYAWLIKSIPNGRGKGIPVLDHLCNTPHCCNPAHLALVLPRKNVMRTSAPPALNFKKDLCKRGHHLSKRHPITGHRRCYECAKLRRPMALIKC